MALVWSAVLFITLSFGSLGSVAHGQTFCLLGCQHDLAACLDAADEDPIQEAICEDNYENCVNRCLGDLDG